MDSGIGWNHIGNISGKPLVNLTGKWTVWLYVNYKSKLNVNYFKIYYDTYVPMWFKNPIAESIFKVNKLLGAFYLYLSHNSKQ